MTTQTFLSVLLKLLGIVSGALGGEKGHRINVEQFCYILNVQK